MSDMNREKQFETMAVLRAYAAEIVCKSPTDLRPSVAEEYEKAVRRMAVLAKSLETQS